LKSYCWVHQLCHESCFFQLHDCSMILQRESVQRLMSFFFSSSFRFWFALEFNQHWATIMFFKVCEIVNVQKSIQTRKDADSWKIKQFQLSIFSTSFAELNLHIFPKFLNRWIDFDQLYNLRQRKFFIRKHLVNIQDRWSINWKTDDFASWMRFDNKKLSLNHLLRWLKESYWE